MELKATLGYNVDLVGGDLYGIHSMELKVGRSRGRRNSRPARNPFNGIERAIADLQNAVKELLAGIHSMELKANVMPPDSVIVLAENPFNGIERAIGLTLSNILDEDQESIQWN